MEFVLEESSGVPYFHIPGFGLTGEVQIVFTTRHGGVSKGPFKTLNLGFSTGDCPQNVMKNRAIFYDALKLSESQIAAVCQIHSDKVVSIKQESDILLYSGVGADAQVTALKNVALLGLFADCLAIFLFDPVNKVIGLAHAGWRGTVLKIADKTLKKMVEDYETDPADCFVALSPSAGPCCYEVGEDVAKSVRKSFGCCSGLLIPNNKGKWNLDLWNANAKVLQEAGIKKENIIISRICTICNQNMFFSYRGSGGLTGRMAALIYLS